MLDVIYEDNHIIVVIKPQNIPTQADDSKDADMLSMVKEYIKTKYNKPGNVYVGLVHRLDRPTGGVMVFAKTSKAAARLTDSIKIGDMSKRYLAVTVGLPKERKAKLTNYLLKNDKTNMVSVVPVGTTGAKYAELSYNVIDSNDKVALVDVDLVTGRSHQIRVQLKHIGTPIYGDVKYSGDKLAKGHNLALWAYSLKFTHPTTKQLMNFKVLPDINQVPFSVFKKTINTLQY